MQYNVACGFSVLTTDMMFVVRRIQELGRVKGVPLYNRCYKKRMVLSSVVFCRTCSPAGILAPVIAVCSHFMTACGHACDHSEWFDVEHGPFWCVRFHHYFFPAVLDVILQRVAADAIILGSFVHLDGEQCGVYGMLTIPALCSDRRKV